MLSKMSKIKRKYKKKTPEQKEREELDEIWTLNIKKRDKYICQICNKKLEKNNCNAHHILPRTIKGLRWEIENGITLCAYHHILGPYSAHKNAIWFTFWLKTNRPAQFKYVADKLIKLGEVIQ